MAIFAAFLKTIVAAKGARVSAFSKTTTEIR